MENINRRLNLILTTADGSFGEGNTILNEAGSNASKMNDTTLKIGDKVTYTNPNGVIFPNHTITGFCEKTSWGAEVHIDGETPWYPVKASSLSVEKIQYIESTIPLNELNANLEIVNIKDTPFKNSKINPPENDFCTLRYKDNYVMIKHHNGSIRMLLNSHSAFEKFITDGGIDNEENLLERLGQTILLAKPFTQEITLSNESHEIAVTSNMNTKENEITYEIIGYKTKADFEQCTGIVLDDGLLNKEDARNIGKDYLSEYKIIKVQSNDREEIDILEQPFLSINTPTHTYDLHLTQQGDPFNLNDPRIYGKKDPIIEFKDSKNGDLIAHYGLSNLESIIKNFKNNVSNEPMYIMYSQHTITNDNVREIVATVHSILNQQIFDNHYTSGLTTPEIAKTLLAERTPKEVVTLLQNHAKETPLKSNKARDWAKDMVRTAKNERNQNTTFKGISR